MSDLNERLAAEQPGELVEVTHEEMKRLLKRLNESATKIARISEQPLGSAVQSDLDRFRALFDRVGMKYEIAPAFIVSNGYAGGPVEIGPVGAMLTIEQNFGCNHGSEFQFIFDAAGKFLVDV